MLREFISFDVETTGLHPVTARVIELAAVRFSAGHVVGAFHTLVNAGVSIPPESQTVHGISEEEIARAPGMEAALAMFEVFRGDLPLVAHNADFDCSFLAMEAARTRTALRPGLVLDSLSFSREVFAAQPSHRLERLSAALGLEAVQHHRAMADAETAGRLVLRALAEAGEPKAVHWIQWSPGTLAVEAKHARLQKAIVDESLIEIFYPGKSEVPVARQVRPLGLVKVFKHAYLHAYCPDVAADRTFRLDKVISIGELVA